MYYNNSASTIYLTFIVSRNRIDSFVIRRIYAKGVTLYVLINRTWQTNVTNNVFRQPVANIISLNRKIIKKDSIISREKIQLYHIKHKFIFKINRR